MSGSVGDNTARASGVIASAGGGGKLLQVVEYITPTHTSRNATSWGDFGSVSQAITPTAASSKILLTFSAGSGGSQNYGRFKFLFDIDGGGYNDVPGQGTASGSRQACHFSYPDSNNGFCTWRYLHTPSYTLTNVLTYKLQSRTGNTSYPIVLGSSYNDSDSASTARASTSLQLIEIGA